MSTVKPILKSTTTSRSLPARTIEKTEWECTCGLGFDTEKGAKLHYGQRHAAEQTVEIRDCTFYLILSPENFDCWRLERRHEFGNHRATTNQEWSGLGWYCSEIENYGRHSGSVWDGEHRIVKAEVVLARWKDEYQMLGSIIRSAESKIRKYEDSNPDHPQ